MYSRKSYYDKLFCCPSKNNKWSNFFATEKNCYLVLKSCSMLWSWFVMRLCPSLASLVMRLMQTSLNAAGFNFNEHSPDGEQK